MAGYALAATEADSDRIASWCWNRALQSSISEEHAYDAILDRCFAAGQPEAAAAYGHAVYDSCGLLPAAAARLTGELVLSNAGEAALRTYERLLEHCNGDFAGAVPAPSQPQPLDGQALGASLATFSRQSELRELESSRTNLGIARLCFSFSAFDTAARLFGHEGARANLNATDHIAYAYSLLRSDGTDRLRNIVEDLHGEVDDLAIDADWLILFATVLFASGKARAAQSVVEKAMRRQYAEHPDLQEIVTDCARMVLELDNCPVALKFGTDDPAGQGAETRNGRRTAACRGRVPKVFVCGNGWSGSGALYDALTEYDCIAEAPEVSIDRHINKCTDNEILFVQENGGLGMIWRQARDAAQLPRLDLWELFRCHVIGAGAIGHTEHKGANTASKLLGRFGSRYTAPFRHLFESVAGLPDGTPLADFREILVEATESLTSTVVEVSDDQCAVLNNAMFGMNIDMAEIFSNFKLAVVVRDPLDQYADRRVQDLRHWMTARRFVPFYRTSRKAFDRQKRLLPQNLAASVREVEFERFVLDEAYRRGVLDWLLEGQARRHVRRRFEPRRSARNIGIHTNLLNEAERNIIDSELRQWRRPKRGISSP